VKKAAFQTVAEHGLIKERTAFMEILNHLDDLW
jgi:hypothetical protein